MSQLPNRRDDADLQALQRQVRFLGNRTADPERGRDGDAWVRTDLTPPELRTRAAGRVWRLPFHPV